MDPGLVVVSNDESDSSTNAEDDKGWFFPKTMASAPTEAPTDNHPPESFELGMSLSYYDGKVKSDIVVYEGASIDDLSHTIRRHDGSQIIIHDYHLRIQLQPDLSNISSMPLEFRNEVNVGISKLEEQSLERPCIITPIQQELMDWHHHLYHFSFPKISGLVELGHLPRRLLDYKKNATLCVAC